MRVKKQRWKVCIEDIDFIDTANFEALNPFIGMRSIVKKKIQLSLANSPSNQ